MSICAATRGARASVLVAGIVVAALGQPHDFCGDGVAFFKGVAKAVADMSGPADAREEGGLEEAWDAECGGDEDDAEGGVGADEQVL